MVIDNEIPRDESPKRIIRATPDARSSVVLVVCQQPSNPCSSLRPCRHERHERDERDENE